MATKKDSTKRSAARKASNAASEQPTGTLELEAIESEHATDSEIERWRIDGAIYSEMLSRSDCPESFRKAFSSIFSERLLQACPATHPAFIGTFYPLVMLSLQGFEPVNAFEVESVFVTLRETLAPGLAKKVQDEMTLD